MKRITILSFFLLICFSAQSQTQLWFEDFENTSQNTSGTAAGTPGGTWSVTTTPSGGTNSFRRQTHSFSRFTIDNTGSEGVFATNIITIPTGKQVAIDISLVTYNASAGDYVRAYYKLDNGPEVLFGSAVGGGDYVISAGASVVLSGGTVQVIVRGMDNTTGNFDGYPRMMRFDDLEVTEIRNLYSRASTAWNVGTTWSTSDPALGVANSCGCTPDNLSSAIVTSGTAVNIPAIGGANAEVVSVTVRSGGALSFTGDETLNINRGGFIAVQSSGSLSSGAGSARVITLAVAGAANNVTVDGALTIGGFNITAAANVIFSGIGAFTVQDEFLITAAATITNNITGSFTVQDDIRFNTSNATFTNNRPLTISSDLIVNDNTDNGNVFTNASTGTLNVVTITPNDGNFTLNNSGTINQTGSFTTLDAGSNFTNLATGTWNWSFVPAAIGDFDNSIYTRLNCSAVGNTFNYTGAGNQYILAVSSYYHLGASGSGSKTLVAALDVNGDMLFQNSTNLNTNGLNSNFAGNWTLSNTAAFNAGATTVTFDGTATQTISKASAGAQSFGNLTINKASGNVVLSSSPATSITTTAAGTLTLTNGGLQLNGNTLRIGNTATTAISRTNGYIISETTGTPYAPVIWTMGTGTGSYVFPFATASAGYIPFTFNITAAGTGAGAISVATYPTNAANTPFPSGVTHVQNAAGGNNSANTVDRFWIITPSIYTANPTATLTFTATAAEVAGITANTLRGQRWNGSYWDLPLAGASGTATTATVPGVNTFSPWGVSGNNSPLPVELKYFKAAIQGDVVKLDWATAQEVNNDFFTVEKTFDLESFEEVVKRAGHGTSTELHHYSEIDSNPYFGRSYYRLKQTDFDGKFTYSKVQMIDYSGPQVAFLSVYPSPSKDRQIIIEIKGLQETKSVPIQIVNSQGQKVMEKTLEVKTPGSVKAEMAFDSSLPSGLYIIKAGNTLRLTQKIVVE